MKPFRRQTVPIVALAALLAGCSIKPPEVKLTGEKTALEREIIGTYHQMAEDTWMVASTRSASDQNKPVMSAEKKKVLEALQQQAFNKDDIEEFKKNGTVGENNQGQLVILTEGGAQIKPGNRDLEDAEKRNLVNDIVAEENQCRQVVMQRVVELNESLKKAVSKDVLAVFAKMYQDNSPKGTWMQTSVGNWTKKK